MSRQSSSRDCLSQSLRKAWSLSIALLSEIWSFQLHNTIWKPQDPPPEGGMQAEREGQVAGREEEGKEEEKGRREGGGAWYLQAVCGSRRKMLSRGSMCKSECEECAPVPTAAGGTRM
jgi:hypothetical protein